MTDAATIEAALARAGWVAGAEALVAGWVDHRQSELIWEETWEPDDRCRYIGTRPTGEKFVVTFSSGDHWEFSISWPDGWGSEHVRMGFVEDLQEAARKLDRAEGPFGGPTRRKVPMCSLRGQRGWRLAGDVELRFEQLREDLAAYFFITREGRLNNLWIVALNPNDLPAALDSLERTPRCAPSLWAQVQGERRAWSFTAWRPVLARMRVAEYELLLVCPDPSTAVILAHVAGRLEAARQVELRARRLVQHHVDQRIEERGVGLGLDRHPLRRARARHRQVRLDLHALHAAHARIGVAPHAHHAATAQTAPTPPEHRVAGGKQSQESRTDWQISPRLFSSQSCFQKTCWYCGTDQSSRRVVPPGSARSR